MAVSDWQWLMGWAFGVDIQLALGQKIGMVTSALGEAVSCLGF
jgi:hypothetical protein